MGREKIVIVSGLPRSGTSMMMRMLEAGGLEVLTDHVRTPDQDNPGGYHEFERVKQIESDQSWLEDARGKAVKIMSHLLFHLPPDYGYSVVFMRRKMDELLASRRKMMERQGEPLEQISDPRMSQVFQNHLETVGVWLDRQPNVDVTYVSYNEILEGALAQANAVNRFIAEDGNVAAMADVVDPALYRQRG